MAEILDIGTGRFIQDTGSGTIYSSYSSQNDYSLTTQPRSNIVSTGSTAALLDDDANIIRTTGAVIDNEFDLVINDPLVTPPETITINNLSPSIVTMNGLSATRVSDGLASIETQSPTRGDRTVQFLVSRTDSGTHDEFVSWDTGTLAEALSDEMDARLIGKEPLTNAADYTLFEWIYGEVVRIPTPSQWQDANDLHGPGESPSGDLIFVPYYEWNADSLVSNVDLSCFSPYNSNLGSRQAGTLVTPIHAIMAYHYRIPTGRTIRFIAPDGTVVSRTIVSGQRIGSTDIYVVKLDSEVPAGVSFAKVLPANWESYLPNVRFEIPVLMTNQWKEIRIGTWDNTLNIPSDGGWFARVRQAGASIPEEDWNASQILRNPWYGLPITGDSGSPVFIILNNEPILLGCWYSGATVPMLSNYITEINAALTSLGGGYSLTTVDLSAYPSF